MAKHRDNAGSDVPPPPEGVAESLGKTYWSVDDCRWPTFQPTLPEHLAALVAPPIVVGAVPVAAGAGTAAATRASGRHRVVGDGEALGTP